MNSSLSPREYHSPVRAARAAETRRNILEAARRLFAGQGYAATSVVQIAAEAGVSVQTVYNSIGAKADLLLALNDLIDEVAEVREIQRCIGESGDAREILALTARLRRQLMEGAGDIVRVLMATAPSDPEVAAAWADAMERSRAGSRRIAERLDALGALPCGREIGEAADTLYALLHPEIWVRLVKECGWSPDAFEGWCAGVLERVLLNPNRG